LVIAGSVEPLDMSKLGDAPVRSNRYRAELVAAGTILTHAHIAGHRAHMWIFDVDSIDDLDRVMSKDPMSPYFSGTPTIYPLVSPERMAEREAMITELFGQKGDA
jgi:muconolactone delta-isomerase